MTKQTPPTPRGKASEGEKREIKFRYRITGSNKVPILKVFSLEELRRGAMNDHYKNNRKIEFCGVFTGLHDCSGKEIYEGDVVEKAFGRVFCVVEADMFNLRRGLEESGLILKIIGNVYENPELLLN